MGLSQWPNLAEKGKGTAVANSLCKLHCKAWLYKLQNVKCLSHWCARVYAVTALEARLTKMKSTTLLVSLVLALAMLTLAVAVVDASAHSGKNAPTASHPKRAAATNAWNKVRSAGRAVAHAAKHAVKTVAHAAKHAGHVAAHAAQHAVHAAAKKVKKAIRHMTPWYRNSPQLVHGLNAWYHPHEHDVAGTLCKTDKPFICIKGVQEAAKFMVSVINAFCFYFFATHADILAVTGREHDGCSQPQRMRSFSL